YSRELTTLRHSHRSDRIDRSLTETLLFSLPTAHTPPTANQAVRTTQGRAAILRLTDLPCYLWTSEVGLSSTDAQQRLTASGPNEAAAPPRLLGLTQLLGLFANPLVLILLLASAVSVFLGDVINADGVVTMVLLSVALNLVEPF